MKLEIERHSESTFPKLAWVANFSPENPTTLIVRCGERVEFGDDYVVEGVWPGPFSERGFSTSELFYGSGLTVSEHTTYFVSSCSTVDRIWSHENEGVITVSNSLPSLLVVAGVDLVGDNADYAKAVETIVKGFDYQKEFPVSQGALRVHYFENLALIDGKLEISVKTGHLPGFKGFEDYSRFMLSTASSIGENARDPVREFPLEVISTISRGYDSPVASVLAKTAGAKRAFTIVSARSLIPRADSGAEIARFIGLECEEYKSNRNLFRDELFYWAANGSLQDMNFSVFDYPESGSVMFTGFNGDKVWSRSPIGTTENFLKRKDSTGLGFCEHRLVKGVIHCPVPFWGIRHLKDLKRISEDESMQPWAVGGDYDRPIPRRIAEEFGIPREKFGQAKSATTVDELLLLPLGTNLIREYKEFLRSNHLSRPEFNLVYAFRSIVDLWRSIFRQRVLSLFSPKSRIRNGSRTFGFEDFLFPWAIQSLKPEVGCRSGREEGAR